MNTEAFFTDGSQIDSANLVRLRNLAPLLPLAKQKKVLNELGGNHSSFLRGRGMDYSEVRQYQAGDDIRSMDWRVTARMDKAHVKVFHEEKERPVLLLCDQRAGMRFGSQRALKSVLAADITALFAWATFSAGDRVGALLFSDEKELNLRPKPGRKAVLNLVRELSLLNSSHAGDEHARLQQVFRHLRRVARPGSRIYIISDWAGFDDECQQHLYHVSRHSDVVAIHLSDPLEQQLPPPGRYPISDGQQRHWLNSLAAKKRQQYQQAFEQRLNSLKRQLLSLQIPLIQLSTANPNPLPLLRTGLGLATTVSSDTTPNTRANL